MDLVHEFISAWRDSLEDVPLGSNPRSRGVRSCRTRRLFISHSNLSGAVAAQRTFLISLLEPVTLRLTSCGYVAQRAANASMKVIRQNKGESGWRLSRMRLALVAPMLPSVMRCRARSSSRVRLGGAVPVKRGPQELERMFGATWFILCSKHRRTFDPAVFFPHWAYS